MTKKNWVGGLFCISVLLELTRTDKKESFNGVVTFSKNCISDKILVHKLRHEYLCSIKLQNSLTVTISGRNQSTS